MPGRKIGEAFVVLSPEFESFGPKVSDNIAKAATEGGKKAGGMFGGSFKQTFGAILSAKGALAIIDKSISFLRGTIDEAAEAAKVTAQTNAVIRSTGGVARISADAVGKLAEAISENVGVDDEAIQAGENLLLTFTRVRNAAGKGNDIFNQATTAIVDMTAAMNKGVISEGGLHSATLQVGKALNDPIKGITALTRVGVTFTAQQKAQIEALVKAGNIMGAQKIILKELTTEFGGSAAAVALPGDKMRVVWANFQEEIGNEVLPVLDSLIPTLKGLLGFVGPIIKSVASWAGHNQTLTKAILIAAAAIWALNVAMNANPIVLVVSAIALLVGAIVWVATKTRWFQDVWAAVWGFLKGVGNWFANDFVGFFKGAWHAIEDAAVAVLRFFVGIFQKINNVVMAVVGAIVHGAAAAFGWVPGIGDKLKDAAKRFDEFRDRVNRTLNGILDQDATVRIHVEVPGVSATARNKIMAGTMAGIRFMQSGGFLAPFGWSWVGEGGPELIRAGRSGAVVASHAQSLAMTRGGGLHLHLHNSVIASERDAENLIFRAWNNLVRTRRIRPELVPT